MHVLWLFELLTGEFSRDLVYRLMYDLWQNGRRHRLVDLFQLGIPLLEARILLALALLAAHLSEL